MPRPFGARNDILNFYTEAMVEGGAPRSESKYVWLPVATIPLFNQRMYDDCPESVTHWLAALPPAFEPPAPRPPPGPRRNSGCGQSRSRYPIAFCFSAAVGFRQFRLLPVFRPGPEGVHRGGRLEAGETRATIKAVSIGFEVSASPVPDSFGTFLTGTRKVRISFFVWAEIDDSAQRLIGVHFLPGQEKYGYIS